MKHLCLSLILMILSITTTYGYSADETHHVMRIEFDPSRSRIIVHDRVTLHHNLAQSGIQFELSNSLKMTDSQPPIQLVGENHENNTLIYEFFNIPADRVFTLKYEGEIDHGITDEREQYSKGIRSSNGLLNDDGIYLHGRSNWYPRFNDQMITFDLTIEGPMDWHIISQGSGSSVEQTEEENSIARWTSKEPMNQIYLVGGPLERFNDDSRPIETLIYLRSNDQVLAQRYIDATTQYIEMYEQLIGPYPYDKFALVENFWETGYGMPSFTLLGSQVIRLPFIMYSSYPHEILHNWWGNSVFVDRESGNWCEGLTAYMADHLLKEQRSQGYQYRRDTLQKYQSYVNESEDFSLKDFRSRHSSSTEAVGYGKSLMLFHMIRRSIGDDAFRESMKNFYTSNIGKRASFDDIRTSVEKVSQTSFDRFFKQWVHEVGAPSIRLMDVRVDPEGRWVDGTIDQTQDGTAYTLDIPMIIVTEDGQLEQTLRVHDRRTSFKFETKDQPLALLVDPSFDLFRLLDPKEIPSSIGQVFGESKILAILPSQEDSQPYRDMMKTWNTPNHQIDIIFDNDIPYIPHDRAVWVLGRTNRFAQSALNIDRSDPLESISFKDEHANLLEHTVVSIHRNPKNDQQTVGFISVSEPEAFPGFIRKLPHYGKYSYLAFKGAEPSIFIKGQWDTTDSPLIVEFVQDGLKSFNRPSRSALHPH